MTRAEAVQQLEAKLTGHINGFFEKMQTEADDAFSAMGWIGEDLHRLMAKSAMAAWEASTEVQEFMKSQGIEA